MDDATTVVVAAALVGGAVYIATREPAVVDDAPDADQGFCGKVGDAGAAVGGYGQFAGIACSLGDWLKGKVLGKSATSTYYRCMIAAIDAYRAPGLSAIAGEQYGYDGPNPRDRQQPGVRGAKRKVDPKAVPSVGWLRQRSIECALKASKLKDKPLTPAQWRMGESQVLAYLNSHYFTGVPWKSDIWLKH